MRIITPANQKDFYDRYSDPTERHTVWVREFRPVMKTEPEVQGINLSVRSLPSGLTRYSKENFLTSVDVERKGYESFPGDYNPLRFPSERWEYRSSKKGYGYSGAFVVFCGRLYRGVTYREDSKSEFGSVTMERYRTYWDLESFKAHHYVKVDKTEIRSFLEEETEKMFEKWFTPDQSKVGAVCVDLDTPVLVYVLHADTQRNNGGYREAQWVWMKNGLLKDLQFVKAMKPDQAAQELSMYLGGVMVKRDPIARVPDKLKVQAHGMDERSFRKDPTKVHR